MKSLKWCLTPAAVMTVMSTTAAAELYVGAALGSTMYEDAEAFAIDEESTTFEASIGSRPLDVFAVEASYLNLGDVYDYENGIDISFSGMTMSAKALLPLGPQMDIFAKMGIFFWELSEDYYGDRYFLEDGEDLIFGGGATFHLTEEFNVTLEYRELDLQELPTSLFTAGVGFRFY